MPESSMTPGSLGFSSFVAAQLFFSPWGLGGTAMIFFQDLGIYIKQL